MNDLLDVLEGKISNKQLHKKIMAKYRVAMPDINRDEYPEIRGLEGPFQFKSGRILYYDPKEGAYYNSKTDVYLDKTETP